MTPRTQKATPNRGLGDFLCFAVYSANLAFGRAYKPILEQVGLTYPQYITIVALSEEDNQTVGSLGEKLFLESNTLTPLLKKLEAMGYVRRARAAADERQVVVSLTEAGRRLREKISTTNLVRASGLNPEEFRRMRKGIADLRDNLIKAGSESANEP
jgi:DNA-binding MarR family transcriptional regulator